MPEENGLLEQLKKELGQRWALEEKNEGLVMAVTEGGIQGKCLHGRRRTAWIDDVRRWTVGGLPAAPGYDR